MLKKLIFILLCAAAIPSAAFAGAGVSVRGGFLAGSSNFDKLDDILYMDKKDYSENFYNFGADIFYEHKISFRALDINEDGYIGVKVGYTKYSDNKISLVSSFYGIDWEVTSTAYAIPVMLYCKYEDPENERWKFWGGLGASFLFNNYEFKEPGYETEKDDLSAVMPKIELGAEFGLGKHVSLFLDLGYQFNGKMETKLLSINYEKFYLDYSGIYADFGVKFYVL